MSMHVPTKARAPFSILIAALAASCTEANPNACANNPRLCAAGTMCVQGKDSNGQGWSRCMPTGEGDGGGMGDDASLPMADAARSSADASVDGSQADTAAGADVGGQIVAPDAYAPDAPAPDALTSDAGSSDLPITCSNQCALGSRRCGNGGGAQDCVMTGACTVWTAEVPCGASRTCQQSGTSASCACPSPLACVAGTQQCGPGGGVRTCTLVGECPAWGSETSCAGPKTC